VLVENIKIYFNKNYLFTNNANISCYCYHINNYRATRLDKFLVTFNVISLIKWAAKFV